MRHLFEKRSDVEQYEGYVKKGYRTFVEMNNDSGHFVIHTVKSAREIFEHYGYDMTFPGLDKLINAMDDAEYGEVISDEDYLEGIMSVSTDYFKISFY